MPAFREQQRLKLLTTAVEVAGLPLDTVTAAAHLSQALDSVLAASGVEQLPCDAARQEVEGDQGVHRASSRLCAMKLNAYTITFSNRRPI